MRKMAKYSNVKDGDKITLTMKNNRCHYCGKRCLNGKVRGTYKGLTLLEHQIVDVIDFDTPITCPSCSAELVAFLDRD